MRCRRHVPWSLPHSQLRRPPLSSPLSLPTCELVSCNHVFYNPFLKFLHIRLLIPMPTYFPSFGGFMPECNLVNSECFGLVFQVLHQTNTKKILPSSEIPCPGLLTSFVPLGPACMVTNNGCLRPSLLALSSLVLAHSEHLVSSYSQPPQTSDNTPHPQQVMLVLLTGDFDFE